MNNFEFILEDVIFEKKITLTKQEFYDLKLALACTSDMYKNSGTIEHRKRSREFLKLESKLERC